MQQFFHNSDVQHAVGIQHTVGQLQLSKSPPLPVAANSETLAVEVIRPVQEVIYLHVLMMKKSIIHYKVGHFLGIQKENKFFVRTNVQLIIIKCKYLHKALI